MPVDSFRFVSPGVFINEIDQSQVETSTVVGSGPVVFGTSEKGPALVPTRVNSFGEFVDLFGQPNPGNAPNSDGWRNGNRADPSYGAYAAQAYLANSAPLTFVRIVGDQESGGTTAGWEIDRMGTSGSPANGASYGLFIVGQGASGSQGPYGEGMLAAVFHTSGSSTTIELSGPDQFPGGVATPALEAAGALVGPVGVGDNHEFRVKISGSSEIVETTFNFDPKSSRYIRKVFNTNPHLLNDQITPSNNLKQHFLAESYERAIIDSISNLSSGAAITRNNLSGTVAVLVGLKSGSAGVYGGDFRQGYATPGTPWIVGQDLTDNSGSFDVNNTVQRLFRVMSKEGTRYAQANYKISFADIKASTNSLYEPYGSFTLMVRDIKDTDEEPRILEQFNNLNLNPQSNNFIGRRIGDRSFVYDSVNQKWKETGQYPVLSKYIRVEMDETVENGDHEAALLPFGFRGIPVYAGANFESGSTQILNYNLGTSGKDVPDGDAALGDGAQLNSVSIVESGGTTDLPGDATSDLPASIGEVFFSRGDLITGAQYVLTASVVAPALPMRAQASNGRLSKNTNAFFGLTTNQSTTTLVFDGSIRDLITIKPTSIGAFNTILSPGFSLDDLVYNAGDAQYSGSDIFVYNATIVGAGNPMTPNVGNLRRGTPQGARRMGLSMTAVSASYTEVLDQGFDRFTVPLYGGFDGFDIFEKSPLNNSRALQGSSKTTSAFPMYYTLRKAIDSVNDPDQVNINMAAMPGVTDSQTTDYLIAMAEERKDTLAVIDLEGGYTASTEGTESFSDRVGNSATVVTNVQNRNFNSSYAAAYYPWVQISDTARNARVWIPSSAIALGVLASSAARSELWFAPAGFNRGGLSNGSAGLNVVNVIEKLTSTQRDNLYDVNVNPIASFPAEGIVVFGQKTLQANPSALDRINVRRLMIFLKKQIREIANNILFDPNEQVTWNRFLNQVNPFLSSIKNRFGLSDYRVILDSSTTTPDMVDRNIMYAKILLKPTRAIEFIALDFVITRSGVEFE